jgi:threonine/homoserine/homoserine lactone efflux protein
MVGAMLEAIGEVLPLGVVTALSPMPIIAVVLILVSARARVNGPLFIVGWFIGLAAVGAVVLLIADPGEASEAGEPATWVGVLELALGGLLLLLAFKQWRSRPAKGEDVAMPRWMGAIDAFTPAKSLGVGALLSGVNPKNTLLSIAAGAAVAGTGISGAEQAVAYGVYAVIGTLGVAIPVVIYFALGDRAPALLGRLQNWMVRHNAAVMAVLLLVIGMKLVGDGLAAL